MNRSFVSLLEKYREEDPLSVTTRIPSLKTCDMNNNVSGDNDDIDKRKKE
jgi:hypothetical protein